MTSAQIYSLEDKPLFPHIKLTREQFPRALATRIINDDPDEYFGAFLNRTAVRILIDFLNRTFRLRTCAIEIDGTFEIPCTQYYSKRCVAPCVSSLCSRTRYLEIVDLVRLFLQNDRRELLSFLERLIDRASAALDFEDAAFFRDIATNVERFWSEPRWQIWLDDTVDTIEVYADDDAVYVIVISQRGRRTLGEMVYAFAALDDPTRVLPRFIDRFYRFHLPRQVRVSHDFEGRDAVASALGERFGRKFDIRIVGRTERRVTAERAIAMTKARVEMERSKIHPTADEISRELRRMFELRSAPRRIEAFDAAHISATGFAAAVSVWADGRDSPEEYDHWLSDRTSELATLRAFVAARVELTSPDLILIDGGRTHRKTAIEAISALPDPPEVIAAVKPKGKHGTISHFLNAEGNRIEFDRDDFVHRLLQRLRDEAHDLANATHRLSRDMLHYYELATMLPSLDERERQRLLREVGSMRKIAALERDELEKKLGREKAERVAEDLSRFREGRLREPRVLIVPVRFVETGGEAEDLIPIETR